MAISVETRQYYLNENRIILRNEEDIKYINLTSIILRKFLIEVLFVVKYHSTHITLLTHTFADTQDRLASYNKCSITF